MEQRDSEEVDEPKGSDQPAKPTAYVSPRRCKSTKPAEAAEHHAGRRDNQEQRAYSGRQRWRQRQRLRPWQRLERGSHSQAAFQGWQEPSEELVLQTYFNHTERPHLNLGTGADMSLYPTFTPIVPMPVEVAQWPHMVYGYWIFMKHQVLDTYSYVAFIPVASVDPYFMPFRAPLFFTFVPW